MSTEMPKICGRYSKNAFLLNPQPLEYSRTASGCHDGWSLHSAAEDAPSSEQTIASRGLTLTCGLHFRTLGKQVSSQAMPLTEHGQSICWHCLKNGVPCDPHSFAGQVLRQPPAWGTGSGMRGVQGGRQSRVRTPIFQCSFYSMPVTAKIQNLGVTSVNGKMPLPLLRLLRNIN